MGPKNASTGRKRGRGADPEQTRSDLIDAAIAALIEDGFRGTCLLYTSDAADE